MSTLLILFSSLVPFIAFYNFIQIDKTKLTTFYYVMIYILTLINMYLTSILGNVAVLCQLISIALFFCIIRENWLHNICYYLTAYIFCVIIDSITSVLINVFTPLTISQIKAHSTYYLIYSLSITCSIYLLSKGLQILFKSKLGKDALTKETGRMLIINLILCATIFVFNIVMGEAVGYTPRITAFNCFLFLLYFVIIVISIVNVMKSYALRTQIEMKQEAFKQMQEYTTRIENMYSELRSFKHDYVNIMLSMSGYLEEEDMAGLKKYFSKTIQPLSQKITKNNSRLNDLMNIQTVELKGIVSAKSNYAMEIGIQISLEITEPVKLNNNYILDISRIIGIFLDNAIEAALDTEEPRIHFSMINNKSSLAIIITNSYNPEQTKTENISALSVSSKGKNRGIGLYNAQSIISDNDNLFLNTEFYDGIFKQHLEVLDNYIN